MQTDTAVNPLIDYYASLSKLYLSNERLISKSYLPKIHAHGCFLGPGFQY